MAKLPVSVESRVITRAKKYAKLQGVSISGMVEAYLDKVANPPTEVRDTASILRSLRGVLKNSDASDYRTHLEVKHR